MDLKIANKLALVSGSTKGIGHAIAVALAREGARVIVNGRSQASVDAALAKLHELRAERAGRRLRRRRLGRRAGRRSS